MSLVVLQLASLVRPDVVTVVHLCPLDSSGFNTLDTPLQMVGSPILCFDRPDKERLFLCAEDSSIREYFTALKNGGLDDRAGRDWLAPGHGGLNQLIYQSFQWPPISKHRIGRDNDQGQSESHPEFERINNILDP